MNYVSWAALYEGATDRAYFEVLLPKIMEEIVLVDGICSSIIPDTPSVLLTRSTINDVAEEAFSARDAFKIVFIHADTGGRLLEGGMEMRSCAYCTAMYLKFKFPLVRCVAISPRHETEAWILADPDAVTSALGYSGSAESLELPITATAAERLVDPKQVLERALKIVRGRHRAVNVQQVFSAIAQRQSVDSLRRAESFRLFEVNLRAALADLGCIK
ncbi:DUF4276 family protein [Telmatospirillum siberiense]|uniref:DUF4276 domain-containing protein n=1 Tax=Telmatospirillum siberiense TaxID=382514 RepID=A0A2N3PZJ0_9PROT|nr:DUF4276 family protein [Telmatospirillum siberiense]PKU25815.1 hypothetical protein CWS72_04445 [Telmatospirillum siberiense]